MCREHQHIRALIVIIISIWPWSNPVLSLFSTFSISCKPSQTHHTLGRKLPAILNELKKSVQSAGVLICKSEHCDTTSAWQLSWPESRMETFSWEYHAELKQTEICSFSYTIGISVGPSGKMPRSGLKPGWGQGLGEGNEDIRNWRMASCCQWRT